MVLPNVFCFVSLDSGHGISVDCRQFVTKYSVPSAPAVDAVLLPVLSKTHLLVGGAGGITRPSAFDDLIL